MNRKSHAFTLIELLIVVAIIGILAAIAVPNFLNARMRAIVAKMETDMKTLGDALMMYRLDHKCFWHDEPKNPYTELSRLTTPTSYIAAIPQDPFRHNSQLYGSITDNYDYSSLPARSCITDYILHGLGPDTDEDLWGFNIDPKAPEDFKLALYNPSNGAISNGDVIHTSWAGLSF
ncbi:MAG: prepilin-type N-terminal cleavage/methylation domain-containing protein [bacterium]